MEDSGTLNAVTPEPQIEIRSGGYTQYPFHPHEAFRGIGPIAELDEGTKHLEEPNAATVGESNEGNNESNDAIEEVTAVSGKYPLHLFNGESQPTNPEPQLHNQYPNPTTKPKKNL